LSSHPKSVNTSRSSVPVPFTNPSSTPSLSTCVDCSSTTNLWICLICGNIGCGRYGRAHAQAHYEKTTHLYALELETQRVWDYAGDGYVHRLIQNKADGKLVELPSAATSTSGNGPGVGGRESGMGPGPSDALTAEKIEAIGIEYSYLLTSQLDSQRVYYEEQMKGMEGKVEDLRKLVERLAGELDQGRKVTSEAQENQKAEWEEKLSEVERDKARSEKRSEKLTELARKLEKELREERVVSEGLMENLKKAKEKVEQVGKEKADYASRVGELEDQVRDVMFFLEARNKIEAGEDGISEAAGGTLEISSNPPRSDGKKKKGKKG
jgi:BRCA1-associated protein